MSRLYWHSLTDGTAEVLGAEFMHCRLVTIKLAKTALPSADVAKQRMTHSAREMIFESNYPHFERDMHLWIDANDEKTDPMFRGEFGEGLENNYLLLNTTLALGNDVVCLFARIAAQTALHAYVEGEHRAWLAGIIRQGLASGLCRTQVYAHNGDGTRFDPRPSGWKSVIELLLARDTEPVVLSYSVDNYWPNPEYAGFSQDNDVSAFAWETMAEGERWMRSLAGLRCRNKTWRLEMSPDTLRLPFGHCVSLFELFNE